jgi:hypothetical protein
MPKHKFLSGDRVLVSLDSDTPNARAGIYTTTKGLFLAAQVLAKDGHPDQRRRR